MFKYVNLFYEITSRYVGGLSNFRMRVYRQGVEAGGEWIS